MLHCGHALVAAAAIWLSNPTLAISEEERLELDRFLFVCEFSHRAKDDPIVHPGHAGMAHSHDFFGNRSTSADSTYESLRAADSTCDLDGDTAAYWLPTLYKNGKALEPVKAAIYYRASYDPESVRAFPPNLRMNSPLKPCPSTHPVRTPDINLNIIYPTSRGAGITFSSGSRYTAHADFINSWKQRALVTLVQTCINDQTRTNNDICTPPHP